MRGTKSEMFLKTSLPLDYSQKASLNDLITLIIG